MTNQLQQIAQNTGIDQVANGDNLGNVSVIAVLNVLGLVIKNLVPVDNNWIPAILLVLGAVVNCMALGAWTGPEIIDGLMLGFGAVGAHQLVTRTKGSPPDAKPPIAVTLTLILLLPVVVGCRSNPSPERVAITTATVTQNSIETAYDMWLDRLVQRVQPFLYEDRPGHKAVDWSKCPDIYAEAKAVDEALKKWKAANGVAVNQWLIVTELTGKAPSVQQLADLRAAFSVESMQLLELLSK